MPLPPNASNFVLNNSPLTDITIINSTGPTGIDILFEASIPDAAHDSSARDPPPRCLPGTREQYIEDVLNWALPSVNVTPLPLYWMKGPAGVGKSAVAQTCAEKLKRQKKLGAAFFFSVNRWSPNDKVLTHGKKEHHKFFTSIAYQLATVYPNYRNLLEAKIRYDRSLVNKTMETQFWELIVQPLQELEEKGLGIGMRVLVLIDGLDECESREAQCKIVEIVAAAARDGAIPLCWAFFSRPEPHIEATFSEIDIVPLCHSVVLPVSHNADGDIELYLRVGFKSILRRLNITMDSSWPSDNDIKQLVRAANGLFIYAKTVLRFIGQPDSLSPDQLLCVVMTLISNPNRCDIAITGSAFAELDVFYMLIMQRIPAKTLPIVHQVLAVLCKRSFPSAILIANFLGLSRVELEAACSQMGAVVYFQRQQEPLELDSAIDTGQSFLHCTNSHLLEGIQDFIWLSLGGSISFYHKSFKDFLLDPRRSGIYCVILLQEIEQQKRDLALQRHNFYHWRGLELVRASGAPDSTSTLSYPFENELVNSFVETLIYYIITGRNMPLEADFDFRKQHYITTTLLRVLPVDPDTASTTLDTSFFRCIRNTELQWLQPDEFLRFDVAEFKKRNKGRHDRNIIRPYHPIPPSLDKSQGRVESGLYSIGQGSKSIFWYWVIDYDSKTYREFRTIDLAEGEMIYLEHFHLSLDD